MILSDKNNPIKESVKNTTLKSTTLQILTTVNRSLIGSTTIDFPARSTMGSLRLSELVGHWVLLFFHPTDYTPVCTSEFVMLAREQDKFADLGVQLLGLSVDSVYSHMG